MTKKGIEKKFYLYYQKANFSFGVMNVLRFVAQKGHFSFLCLLSEFASNLVSRDSFSTDDLQNINNLHLLSEYFYIKKIKIIILVPF